MAEQCCCSGAGFSLGDQENSVKPMIIPRVVIAPDLTLDPGYRGGGGIDSQASHTELLLA